MWTAGFKSQLWLWRGCYFKSLSYVKNSLPYDYWKVLDLVCLGRSEKSQVFGFPNPPHSYYYAYTYEHTSRHTI